MAELTKVDEVLATLDKNITKFTKKEKDGRVNNGGGYRGGGMPPGAITKPKLKLITMQQAVNQRIMQNADKLVNAALSLAVGTQKLMVIVTEGEGKNARRRHEVVTDEETIKQYLDWNEGINDADSPDDEKHYYYLSTDKPDIRAIDSLMNRALGKAPDKLIIEGGFFVQSNLNIQVVGSHHDAIEMGEDGQFVTDNGNEDTGADTQRETIPSDTAS